MCSTLHLKTDNKMKIAVKFLVHADYDHCIRIKS
jgi:hypothetical protein